MNLEDFTPDFKAYYRCQGTHPIPRALPHQSPLRAPLLIASHGGQGFTYKVQGGGGGDTTILSVAQPNLKRGKRI